MLPYAQGEVGEREVQLDVLSMSLLAEKTKVFPVPDFTLKYMATLKLSFRTLLLF